MKLAYMVGMWQSSAIETNTDGDRFEQTGTWACTWTPDSNAIVCREDYTVVHSMGRYDALPKRRQFTVTYSYNSRTKLYECSEEGNAKPLALAENGQVIYRQLVFYSGAKKCPILGMEERRYDQQGVMTISLVLRVVEGGFTEHYTEKLVRQALKK